MHFVDTREKGEQKTLNITEQCSINYPPNCTQADKNKRFSGIQRRYIRVSLGNLVVGRDFID